MKITREALKTIVKETMIEESEYQEFFKKALEKAGKSIPDMSDEEKKAFFNNIEKTWKGKGPKKEISETELEEAQSPAQKAAFAKMLAKKDGKDESTDDEKEEVKESVSEEFKGNGNDFKYKFTMNLESHLQRTDKKHEIGKRDAYTSIEKITAKKDKRYEVRLSNHLSDKTFLEKVGKGIGAKLVDFKKGSTNIALYESVSEAAPKMKKSAESEKLQKVYRAAELSQKGGSPSRYSREFESAKKKALKYIGDMITYTKIGK